MRFLGVFVLGVLLISVGFVEASVAISDCAGLQNMNSDLSGDYYLIQDIDCNIAPYNSGAGFAPVEVFSGTFDGRGYKINNLFISRSGEDEVGLFGNTTTAASIKNVGMINVNVRGDLRVGGLVGLYRGSSPLTDSYSTGTVSGNYGTGGLVGYVLRPGKIVNSYSTANVIGTTWSGGLVGYARGDIIESYATGDVSNSGSYSGGLTSWSDDDIVNCYAKGQVGASRVGGLVGEVWGSSGGPPVGSIINCYAVGQVSGGSAGGVLGVINGGLAAESGNFWDTQTTGQSSSRIGVGRTTAQMKQQSTFAGWDFVNVWDVDGVTNNGYPFLRMNDFCGDGVCGSGESSDDCPGDCLRDSGLKIQVSGQVVSIVAENVAADSRLKFMSGGVEYGLALVPVGDVEGSGVRVMIDGVELELRKFG